jgi:cytochrome c5
MRNSIPGCLAAALCSVAGLAAAADAPSERSGESIVAMRCAQCHGTGVAGAPRIGDRAAWIDRAKTGLDGLVRSAIRGHGSMPSRGGLADLTDPETRAAVTYMVEKSLKPPTQDKKP